jgi:hypothetical protein
MPVTTSEATAAVNFIKTIVFCLHLQTNVQVEKANGLVCNGIKKRLMAPFYRAEILVRAFTRTLTLSSSVIGFIWIPEKRKSSKYTTVWKKHKKMWLGGFAALTLHSGARF